MCVYLQQYTENDYEKLEDDQRRIEALRACGLNNTVYVDEKYLTTQ